MKKILLLLAVVGITSFIACEGPEGPQGDPGPEAQVFELNNINFGFSNDLGYNIYRVFNTPIYDSDNVIMYRLSGTIDSQTPIWQQIPRTLYLDGGDELDYDFDFSPVDFTIYAGGNYDISTTPAYINNQTFRIVIIPGYFTNKSKAVDLSDYNAVITAYNIDASHIKVIQ